jgi:hypothetical protein
MARHFTSVGRHQPRVGPEDLPGVIGLLADVDKPGEIVGVAFGADHLGGWRCDWSRPGVEPEDLGPREATWRLVVSKVEVEFRFVLRAGELVELAEDAI